MSSVADFPVDDEKWLPVCCCGGASVRGVRRDKNEDCFAVDPRGRIFVVADGIGGTVGGNVASQMACDVLCEYLTRLVRVDSSCEESDFECLCDREDQVCAELLAAMKRANDQIVAERSRCWSLRDMGTTAIAAVVIEERLYLANIGDSRAYLVREGVALRLTRDHTMTAGLVAAGLLTADEAPTHHYRNVLYKYLGAWTDDDPADVQSLRLQHGDTLVLATDGVTRWVSETEIATACDRSDDLQHAAETLTRQAVESGSTDDATCVVAHLT